MQIACPKCGVKYNLSAQQIGENGRTVRCVKCKHQWLQPAISSVPAQSVADTPPLPPQNTQLNATAPISSVNQAKERMKKKVLVSLFGSFVVILLIFSTLMLMKNSVIKAMPAMSGFYQTIGIGNDSGAATSATGLIIPADEIERSLDESPSQTILTFKGKVVNTNTVTVPVPEIKVIIIDDHGIELDSWKVQVKKTSLEPNESTSWVCRFFNPPLERIAEHKVVFVTR